MAGKSSDGQAKKSARQRKVLEHIAESGNISYSCKRAGISRETYYAWREEDQVFAEDADIAVDYGKSFVNDLAHNQLIRNIQQGNMQAVRFQLVSCHPDYRPKRPGPAEELKPVTSINIQVLDPSKVAEIKEELRKRRNEAGSDSAA